MTLDMVPTLVHAAAFYIFALVAVASGAMVVSARNPVHSVLFLILAFFNAAALFLIAGAEFLAMILVIVYVGAVAVLFLFVVMMLDINLTELREGFLKYLPVGALIGAVLFAEILFGLGVLGSDSGTLASLAAGVPLGLLAGYAGGWVDGVLSRVVDAMLAVPFLILAIAAVVFQVPVRGSMILLMLGLGLFIASNLALGMTFSTIATNQMQAVQMAQFTLMPSFLLSGFMFPFAGMPNWAQWVGEFLPLTHYLRIVRSIMLKGATISDLRFDTLALAGLMLIAMTIAVTRFRRTLD